MRFLRLAGVLMLVASVAALLMGSIFLFLGTSTSNYYHAPDYSFCLYLAVLNFVATGVCVAGGLSLLRRSYSRLAAASIVVLLASGIAPLILWTMATGFILNGLIFGLPMVVFSLVVPFLVWLSKVKTEPMMDALRRYAASVMLLSTGITTFFGISFLTWHASGEEYYMFYFDFLQRGFGLPAVFGDEYLGVLNCLAAAFCLAGGIALWKKRYFVLSVTGIALLLASGIAPQIAWAMAGIGWVGGLLFGLTQLGLSLAAIVLVGLSKLQAKLYFNQT